MTDSLLRQGYGPKPLFTDPPTDAGSLLRAICDESCQNAHAFMVFGGLLMADSRHRELDALIDEWREANNMFAELKWTKASKGKLNEYRSLVDLFFDYAIAPSHVHVAFRAMVVETAKIDYQTYHDNDRELGFYKFFNLFLTHKFCRHAVERECRVLVQLDQRTTKQSLKEFHTILNRTVRKKIGGERDVVSAVEPVDSKRSNLMQLADVLMGAVGFHYNRWHDLHSAAAPKRELAQHIADRLGIQSLRHAIPRHRTEFEVWRLELGKSRPNKR